MPQVNASLNNAAFENVSRFRIVNGQAFSLALVDYEGPIDWAHTGDRNVEIIPSEDPEQHTADLKATGLGKSRIFVIEKSETEFNIIKQVWLEVVAEILDPATSLNATGEPIDKPIL